MVGKIIEWLDNMYSITTKINEVYLRSFFNYAINIIFASCTGWLLYSQERTQWIRVFKSLDDVASCVLYFSSVSTFWHVFYCQLKYWVFTKSDRFLGIHSRNKLWKFNVMWLPFQSRVLLLTYKQQAWCSVRRYDSTYRRGQKLLRTFAAFIRTHPSDWIVNAFFQKDKACMCICTSTWVALSNICLTTVNMTNVFYCKISEYAVGAGMGLIWLRIGAGGGHLWMQ